MIDIVYERAKRVAETLSMFKEDFIVLLEKKDPQYHAVKLLALKNPRVAAIVSIANALISYQLTGRGEDYWSEVGRYFVEKNIVNPVELFLEFKDFLLNHTRYNRRYVYTKISRLEKLWKSNLLNTLWENPTLYCRCQEKLLGELVRIYRQPWSAKTLVFAVKMYYYFCKARGLDVKPSQKIPMPCDRRICFITLSSGILYIKGAIITWNNIWGYVDLLMKKHRDSLVQAWFLVSKLSGLPAIYMDTIIWLLARFIMRGRSIEDIYKEFTRVYEVEFLPSKLVKSLIHELLFILHVA
ncbi:MAG: N-glycosylase/DNA lyase [Desulfurococcales archaeon]|nr:N-glycosylase/DNA lyase [Desulfurococcales archaeon]